MKRIILLLAIGLFSCEKDNLTPSPVTEDCDCDRVVSSNSFTLPGGITFGNWSTVNDCTNQTVNGEWSSAYGETKPVIGTCK